VDIGDHLEGLAKEGIDPLSVAANGWGVGSAGGEEGTDALDQSRKRREEQATSGSRPAEGVTLLNGSNIKPEPVAWLWDGWLAKGKVHVLAGAPGAGKTTLALALGAALTTAGRWPDGTPAVAGDLVIWSGEDDPQDTLAPRLIACGADMSRVHFVASMTDAQGTRSFDPATDGKALSDELALLDSPPALLIVDPLVSAVSGDSNQSAVVRRALQPLVDLAQTRRCAVLGISHFSKGTAARDPVERVTGSLAFGALARVVLGAAKLPDSEGGGRILVRAKNNLGPDSGGYRYHLEPCELDAHPGVFTIQVLWGDALLGTARELLGLAEPPTDTEDGGRHGALGEAEDFLRDLLKNGPRAYKEIMADARGAGHSERTIVRAKGALGVKSFKEDMSGPWNWHLLPEDRQEGSLSKTWHPSGKRGSVTH